MNSNGKLCSLLVETLLLRSNLESRSNVNYKYFDLLLFLFFHIYSWVSTLVSVQKSHVRKTKMGHDEACPTPVEHSPQHLLQNIDVLLFLELIQTSGGFVFL